MVSLLKIINHIGPISCSLITTGQGDDLNLNKYCKTKNYAVEHSFLNYLSVISVIGSPTLPFGI